MLHKQQDGLQPYVKIVLKSEVSMIELLWNEKFSVRNYEIDKQHKVLFNMINDINKYRELNIINSGLIIMLKELKEYVEYHLKYEENLLKKINYKELESHKKIHYQFINTINKIEKNILNMDVNDYIELGIFLTKWLYKHVLVEDKQYVKYLNKKEYKLC